MRSRQNASKQRWLFVLCLALTLAVQVANVFAQVPQGPDKQPLPGAPGGLDVPPAPRNVTPPDLGPFKKLGDVAEKNKKEQSEKPSGSVEAPLVPGGPKVTMKWDRVDGTHCKFSVTLGRPPEGVTLTFEVTHDAQGVAHWKATLPPIRGQERHDGPNYIFDAAAPGCKDAIWVQYIERRDTLSNDKGTVIGTNTLGPGIDGGVPYPIQETTGDNHVTQDSPGSMGPSGSTDQQMADGEIANLRKELNLKNDKAGSKGKREFKFWTYLICLKEKYEVIGHFEWGFTINIDTKNPPQMKVSDDHEPKWTAGK